MRVAVTGADGFTGVHVLNALAAAGIESVTLAADLTNAHAVDQEVAGAEFDALIHLAGHAFVDVQDWEPFVTVNEIGTFRLLDAVARYHPGVRCLIASSAQVYGPRASGLIREDAPAEPSNHYALSKHAMELGARLRSNRLTITAVRPFNYTGIGQSTQYLIPKLVRHFRDRAPVIRLGNTRVRRDIGDVRAVAEAYVGLTNAVTVPPVVNICTGVLYSVDEMVRLLTHMTGHEICVEVDQALIRANDIDRLGGDPALLRQTLPRWSPRPIADTLAWMLNAS